MLPMVLCLFVILIYAAFFLHDRCLFGQDAYLVCFRECHRKDSDLHRGPSPQKIREAGQSQFGEKYLAVSRCSTGVEVRGKEAVFSVNAAVFPSSFGRYFLMPQNIWTIRAAARATQTDPPLAFRGVRRKLYVLKEAAAYASKAAAGP